MTFWLSHICLPLSQTNVRHSHTDSASGVVWCVSRLPFFADPSLLLSAAPIMPSDDSPFANFSAFNCLRCVRAFHNSTFKVISMASGIPHPVCSLAPLLSREPIRQLDSNRGRGEWLCVSWIRFSALKNFALNNSLGLLREWFMVLAGDSTTTFLLAKLPNATLPIPCGCSWKRLQEVSVREGLIPHDTLCSLVSRLHLAGTKKTLPTTSAQIHHATCYRWGTAMAVEALLHQLLAVSTVALFDPFHWFQCSCV